MEAILSIKIPKNISANAFRRRILALAGVREVALVECADTARNIVFVIGIGKKCADALKSRNTLFGFPPPSRSFDISEIRLLFRTYERKKRR
ncbi:MAG: hypothetical protein HYW88_03345 [Candidatus Sungbacteria bacterium]|nr:hypothetical protein [Candidatus Sungbacteria bacterium]